MSGKLNVTVGLRIRPLPKVELRATLGGEICANMGAHNDEITVAQKGFQLDVFEKVVIWGTNDQGRAVDYAAFGVSDTPNATDLVSIDADDSISFIQRTDRGAAEGVSRTYARFLSLGLHPTIRFYYRPAIANNPKLRAQYDAQLGLVDREEMQVADGYVIDRSRLTPGKDRGSFFEFGRGRRVR